MKELKKLLQQLFDEFEKANSDWEDFCDDKYDLVKECLL